MSKFVVEPCNDVNGTIPFFKIIEDSKCYWNEFCIEIEKDGTWENQLDQLKSRMDEISNLKSLPFKKFHKLDPPSIDEYEVKTDNLRAYLILYKSTYIILYAGKKTNQVKDLKTFKKIRERYLNAKTTDITRKTS